MENVETDPGDVGQESEDASQVHVVSQKGNLKFIFHEKLKNILDNWRDIDSICEERVLSVWVAMHDS